MKPNPLDVFLIKIWSAVLAGLIVGFVLLNSALSGLK